MDNVYAGRLAQACRNAEPGGDSIDHGWSILKALHAEGFDVVPREPINNHPKRTLNEMCGLVHGATNPPEKPDSSLRDDVKMAISLQISEGLGAVLRKFCDSPEAARARHHLHKMPDDDWATLVSILSQESAYAAIAVVVERCAAACEQKAQDFRSPEYSTNQPESSFAERFACGQCADEIRALARKEG